MGPDKFQQAWQAQGAQTRVTVDSEVLLKEVQRNQRDFRAMIFCRDFREIVIALLLIPLWFYLGAKTSSPWTWYLSVPALLWMAGFMWAYRKRHPQQPSKPDEPLLECAKRSLREVEDQIWLLRNIFWWYLLPPGISIGAFFLQVSWQGAVATNDWLTGLIAATCLLAFLAGIYYFVYCLNQRAVRVQLEPRREELLALLASFGDELTSDYVAWSRAQGIESSRSLRRWVVVALTCLAALAAIAMASGLFQSSDSADDQPPRSVGPAGDALASVVARQRQEKGLVGLAAMVTTGGEVYAAAADGEREIDDGVPIEIGDRWHLGGLAKSVTATMIARLIESGQMQWTDTVGEVFAKASVHEDWKPVTLRQLLTDAAGAPPNFPKELWHKRPARGLKRVQARHDAVLEVIAAHPAYPPGAKYVYSNVGYTIAAAMAESVTGLAWEDLVEREVFEPLALSGAGFGPPQSTNETRQQPRGHFSAGSSKVAMDDTVDNTPIIAPAAAIHMTLEDLCRFADEHMLGELGRGQLLSAESYRLLHTPQLNHYACGWIRKAPGKAIPCTMYWHNGSNKMWYALAVFIPETNTVVAVASNDGDFQNAERAAWEIVKASAKQNRVLAERPLDEE